MRAVRIVALILAVMMIQGCWGSRESDEIAYVLAMGFDKGPGQNVIISFQIANPKAIAGVAGGGGGGGGADSRPLITDSIVALLPIGAFKLLNVERSREISLLHTTAFIFSEEVARQGLTPYLNSLERYRETRGTSFVFICRGKAKEFIKKNQPILEINPSKQYELLDRTSMLHGLTPVTQFSEFYLRTKSMAANPVAPLVAVSRKNTDVKEQPPKNRLGDYLAGEMPSDGDRSQFLGAAVFRRDRMVGELTGDETRYLNMITGKIRESFINIEDPLRKGKSLGVTLRQTRSPGVKINIDGSRPEIKVDIYQEPEIVGISSGINYESTDLKPVLEEALEKIIRDRCREVVSRAQEEFRSDIFGFGRYARMKFLTLGQWREYSWEDAFPTAAVDIHVHVKIRRTGLMLETMPPR
ncbi:MAG: Ger(x)C family spore germination protein [Bacillota bacterium]